MIIVKVYPLIAFGTEMNKWKQFRGHQLADRMSWPREKMPFSREKCEVKTNAKMDDNDDYDNDNDDKDRHLTIFSSSN